jgi:hypothetical protein
VTRPSIKITNVLDGMLPQFIVLSDLLLDMDKDHEFYCGPVEGNHRRIHHAHRLMDEDPLISPEDCERNVIESVSGICNVYWKASSDNMFTGAHTAKFGVDHGSSPTPQSTNQEVGCTKNSMKAKFTEWGIDLKWVSLFPHIDDFNGRDPGQNLLGVVTKRTKDSRSKQNVASG